MVHAFQVASRDTIYIISPGDRFDTDPLVIDRNVSLTSQRLSLLPH